MSKHARNGHGNRAYVSLDARTIRLLSPLSVAPLCITAQGHYITPLVQQAMMDYRAVVDAEVSQSTVSLLLRQLAPLSKQRVIQHHQWARPLKSGRKDRSE